MPPFIQIDGHIVAVHQITALSRAEESGNVYLWTTSSPEARIFYGLEAERLWDWATNRSLVLVEQSHAAHRHNGNGHTRGLVANNGRR